MCGCADPSSGDDFDRLNFPAAGDILKFTAYMGVVGRAGFGEGGEAIDVCGIIGDGGCGEGGVAEGSLITDGFGDGVKIVIGNAECSVFRGDIVADGDAMNEVVRGIARACGDFVDRVNATGHEGDADPGKDTDDAEDDACDRHPAASFGGASGADHADDTKNDSEEAGEEGNTYQQTANEAGERRF